MRIEALSQITLQLDKRRTLKARLPLAVFTLGDLLEKAFYLSDQIVRLTFGCPL